MTTSRITFDGLATAPQSEQAVFRTRMNHAVNDFAERSGFADLDVHVSRRNGDRLPVKQAELNGEKADDLRHNFQSRRPDIALERVCLPDAIHELMRSAVAAIQHERTLFEEWGLSEIQAHPRAALLFNGPPGTGKTAAAHGLASHLGLPILSATTADLESKFLGEGPKRVAALFAAAREQNALTLIDEADTLLSSRMKVTQGSERAANSMTSQLLVELEQHRGVVVFATNLLQNVDDAFTTRVLRIDFPMPDRAMRYEIWKKLLPHKLPLDSSVDLEVLADIDGVCGRDIRNAVILAASTAVALGRTTITGNDLAEAIRKPTSPQ